MRPTRRGYAVVAVVVGAVAVGAAFGARSLDAVVLPGTVAVVAAAVQVWRAPTPTVERTVPPADEPGTTGVVELRLDAPRTYPATIRDGLSPGIDVAADGAARAGGGDGAADAPAGEAVIDAAIGGTVSYEILRTRRGRHELGPLTVVLTDVLGLFERTVELGDRSELLVFPPVRTLSETAEANLRALARSRRANRRDEFDDLREYVRGDALRDVHWKSSAKRGELMIREFTAEADPDRVSVVAGVEATESPAAGGDATASSGTATDAMAEAAASVCLAVIRDGATVALTTPAGEVSAGSDDTRAVLEHLAVVGGGPLPVVDDEPDVAIVVGDERTVVRFDGRERRFESLLADSAVAEATNGPAAGGVGGDADGAGSTARPASTTASGEANRAAPARDRRGGGSAG